MRSVQITFSGLSLTAELCIRGLDGNKNWKAASAEGGGTTDCNDLNPIWVFV